MTIYATVPVPVHLRVSLWICGCLGADAIVCLETFLLSIFAAI